MHACVFCRVRGGSARASVVHQDDLVLAFMDLMPINPGHVLVVPRMHATGLGEVPDQVGARMWSLGRRLGGALRASPVRCEGVNLFLADGAAAFQTVFHAHLHVIPRFTGDSFPLQGPRAQAPRRELEEGAAQLRELLAHVH
ncbi:HIT family protein [Nocardiopsis kunsanensis]|uniref:HIT family protein n=1 Tax=Nocardiopsis kunsanensis TaxID=141693 RepID=A0A919CLD3_9ACTN|nr:HIT family protein [Nocardiopsis kunsanensis]GHD36476.1 HIT family protein [Nocardiopsis kunsanensis]